MKRWWYSLNNTYVHSGFRFLCSHPYSSTRTNLSYYCTQHFCHIDVGQLSIHLLPHNWICSPVDSLANIHTRIHLRYYYIWCLGDSDFHLLHPFEHTHRCLKFDYFEFSPTERHIPKYIIVQNSARNYNKTHWVKGKRKPNYLNENLSTLCCV